MQTTTLRQAFVLLFMAGIVSAASAIIVWDGKIVPEWPESPRPFLRKTAAVSPDDNTPEGFGFYTRPTGIVYCLTMIVDFSDEEAAFTREQVNDWLNKPGFSMGSTNGSVRDYYYECSNGKLELVNDVFGYYRAAKTRAYYEGVQGYSGAGELVQEMIDHFDAEVDFSKYDNDGDGRTEAINFVYAGSGKTWGQGLWPHSGNVGKTRDGVQIGRYNMSDMGRSLAIYVFCHETGHMIFGWPDLYWFGDYCIMGNRMSDANPQAINDFFRADQGWIPTTDIAPDDNSAFTATHNGGGYRYVNPSDSDEMYFWSVVKSEGRWANLRGDGIVVYHFDAGIRNNSSGTRRTLYVVEADGNNALAGDQWPSPGSDADDFFNAENNAEFSETTDPASDWGLKIYDISEAGGTMTFKVGTGVVALQMPVVRQGRNLIDESIGAFRFDLLGRIRGTSITADIGSRVAPGWYVTGEQGRWKSSVKTGF